MNWRNKLKINCAKSSLHQAIKRAAGPMWRKVYVFLTFPQSATVTTPSLSFLVFPHHHAQSPESTKPTPFRAVPASSATVPASALSHQHPKYRCHC